MSRRPRRAARWPRGAGWEFAHAALREPSEGELEFERKARIERVLSQLSRHRNGKRQTPHEPSRQQIRMQLDGVRREASE